MVNRFPSTKRVLLLTFLVISSLLLGALSSLRPEYVKAQSGGIVAIPFVVKNYQSYLGGFGDVSGQVSDAQSNAPLGGALICSAVPCNQGVFTFSDAEGKFYLSQIPSGERLISASLSGYESLAQSVIVKPDEEVVANFALSSIITSAGVLRIVLTWSDSPADLDAFLWTPIPEYPVIFYDKRGNCEESPFACLDRDDRDGYGPETTSIIQTQPGKYVYGVHNPDYSIFPNITPIIESAAQVRVYDSTGVINEFHVPKVGQGDLWYVFDFDGETNEITPVNCITDYGSGGVPACRP